MCSLSNGTFMITTRSTLSQPPHFSRISLAMAWPAKTATV